MYTISRNNLYTILDKNIYTTIKFVFINRYNFILVLGLNNLGTVPKMLSGPTRLCFPKCQCSLEKI